MPKRNDIAICGRGYTGVITCDTPAKVTYADGSVGEAWTGIHLRYDRGKCPGEPWCSRIPTIIGNLDDLQQHAANIAYADTAT
jgi:hypothetical protein